METRDLAPDHDAAAPVEIEGEWMPIGALLRRRGVITAEQLELALEERELSGQRLGEILVDRGWATSREIAVALAEQFGLPFHDLEATPPPAEEPGVLPLAPAAALEALVVRRDEAGLVVGIADPTNIAAIDALREHVDAAVELVVVDAAALPRCAV